VSGREAVRDWGQSSGLFVDGRNIYKGPPLSCEKIKKAVEKKMRKL